MKAILLLWGLILPALIFAQNLPVKCGTDEVFLQWMSKNPTFKQEFEQQYKEISQTPNGNPTNGVTRTVTTVQSWPANSQDIKFDAEEEKTSGPEMSI